VFFLAVFAIELPQSAAATDPARNNRATCGHALRALR